MMPNFLAQDAIDLLTHHTGVVIPVYFRPAADESELAVGAALLEDTVRMALRELANPAMLCLSVDGPGPGVVIAETIARRFGTTLILGDENRGKLSALRDGAAALLDRSDVRYLAAIDADGDHFPGELLTFLRVGEHTQRAQNSERVLLLGNRRERHRPLGFLRGEQEELADRILLDALTYHAAVSGRPLELQFANLVTDVPDFHSGYKVFSRRTAEDVFLSPPQLAGCRPEAYYRHAIEAVMTVEAVLAGATLATVERSAFNEQPISSFASINRSLLHADLIVWPCKRLGIPPAFVRQWMTNHLHRLMLATLVPQGRDELLAIRNFVLAAFEIPPPPDGEDLMARPLIA